jgi:hypothetical protein
MRETTTQNTTRKLTVVGKAESAPCKASGCRVKTVYIPEEVEFGCLRLQRAPCSDNKKAMGQGVSMHEWWVKKDHGSGLRVANRGSQP